MHKDDMTKVSSFGGKNTNVNNSQLEEIFNHATIGILVTDSNGLIVAVNKYALDEFGYTKEELIGNKVEILIPSRFHNRKFNKTKKNKGEVGGKAIKEDTLFAVTKYGKEFPVEVSLGTYSSKGENYVIAFIHDISVHALAEEKTERRNYELELKIEQKTAELNETLRQLAISNDQLAISKDQLALSKEELAHSLLLRNALIDHAGVMIIATDLRGVIKLINPEACLNLGYKEEEIINKRNPILFHCNKDIKRMRAILLREFKVKPKDDFAVLVEKSKRGIHDEEQYTYKRKNGSCFPVSLTITAIRNVAGRITGYVAIAVDISFRKKAQDDLRKALEKEKELSSLKSRFVSLASHEFRTPLSTILSSAYLLSNYTGPEANDKREKHISRIISVVNMLTDILNDFLSAGKIEEGKIQVRQSVFNIYELIQATIGDMENTLRKNQKIHYAHEGNKYVFMDSSLLQHIVMNLISNASKFSSENDPIEIKTNCQNDQVFLTVKDQGIGISVEDQKHLMERFYRGSNTLNIQGTGLGLHIVSKYAELMNGMIQCKSKLDEGTEFIIIFNTKTFPDEKDFIN